MFFLCMVNFISHFPVYTHHGKKECQQCAEGLGSKERHFQNWVCALLHATKQENFYELPQAPSQSHCYHTTYFMLPLSCSCVPTPEGLQLRFYCWPECQGVLTLPREEETSSS